MATKSVGVSVGVNMAAFGMVKATRKIRVASVTASKTMSSKLVVVLNGLAIELGIPKPVAEYRFHPTRRWRFDAAYPSHLIAVEYEGMSGRHQTWTGFIGDCQKYNAAAVMGWLLIRVTCKTMHTLPDLLERAFTYRRSL